MTPGIRMTGLRWLLLSLLLLGVVSMHHFLPTSGAHGPESVAVTTMADMSSPDPLHQPEEPAPSPAHDSQHLCMAIVGAIVGLLLVGFLFAFFWRPPLPSVRRVRHIRRVERPPRLFGRTLLSSVCVLRV